MPLTHYGITASGPPGWCTISSLELTVRADCNGIDSEMFALHELGQALLELLNARVTWILRMACEIGKLSCVFANAQP